jgi:hypothetical protein
MFDAEVEIGFELEVLFQGQVGKVHRILRLYGGLFIAGYLRQDVVLIGHGCGTGFDEFLCNVELIFALFHPLFGIVEQFFRQQNVEVSRGDEQTQVVYGAFGIRGGGLEIPVGLFDAVADQSTVENIDTGVDTETVVGSGFGAECVAGWVNGSPELFAEVYVGAHVGQSGSLCLFFSDGCRTDIGECLLDGNIVVTGKINTAFE